MIEIDPGVLDDMGAMRVFQKVAIKPGKPVGCYIKDNKVIIALPGNPVAAYVSFLLFGLPALYRLQNRQYEQDTETVILRDNIIRKFADREELLPVRLGDKQDYELLDYNGSAHLAALSRSNGLLIIPRGQLRLEAGDSAIAIVIPQ